MSKICQITGKKAIVGNNVSHSKRRTKRKFNVNLFNKKFYWVEQGVWIMLTISAAGLRTINKLGLNAAMEEAVRKGNLNPNEIKFLALSHLYSHFKMAKKSKDARVQVILECTEHKASGMPGTSRYVTTKNRKNTPERLELKKFNPILKRMTIHKEIK